MFLGFILLFSLFTRSRLLVFRSKTSDSMSKIPMLCWPSSVCWLVCFYLTQALRTIAIGSCLCGLGGVGCDQHFYTKYLIVFESILKQHYFFLWIKYWLVLWVLKFFLRRTEYVWRKRFSVLTASMAPSLDAEKLLFFDSPTTCRLGC